MFLKNKNFFDDPAPLKERTEKTDVQEEKESSGKEQKDWEDVNLSFYDELLWRGFRSWKGIAVRPAGRTYWNSWLPSERTWRRKNSVWR